MSMRVVFGAVSVLAFAGMANADSVQVNFQAGNTNTTTALTGFATTGAMMDGMVLTAYFVGGSSDTAIWGDTGATSGAAFGAGWTVSEAGDTYNNGAWSFANASGLGITKLVIDAGPGNTVFDTTFGGTFGTNGSANGRDFTVTSGLTGLDITATYEDRVALTGFGPVGDLFRFLEIDFTTRGIAFDSGRTLGFGQDTDNLQFAGDLQVVPLPTGSALAGLGLCAAAFSRRRR